MTTIAIMQPYLFPYIGYFQLLASVDRFVVYDDVTFIKQGWINRNRMLINGQAAFFTVPLEHRSSAVAIRDTRISDAPQHRQWPEKLMKSFDSAYRRAPEFVSTRPLVELVLARAGFRIAELALDSIKTIADRLEIRTPIVPTSTIYGNGHLRGEDRVLAICKAEKASRYVNLAGGRSLYSRERFAAEGIELCFIEPTPVEYRQFDDAFVPSLSIVDVLMFNPVDRVRGFLNACEVV
ncbi:MAG TPA: WbqC family protein [Vicinamibacterales bacterium]|nr:WbqC family protein [Vicinamibacterales bacterium]